MNVLFENLLKNLKRNEIVEMKTKTNLVEIIAYQTGDNFDSNKQLKHC